MIKLLQINTTLNCSSTGRIAEQIADLMTEKGWDCYIAHGGRYIGHSNHKTIKISGKIDNFLHAFLVRLTGLNGLGSFFSTLLFVNKIKKIKPDIIHLHNVHGYYINYIILFNYLSKLNIPVVWTLHDCWAITGHCTHFDGIGCMRWKEKCYKCPLKEDNYKNYGIDTSKYNYYLKKKYFNLVQSMTLVPVSYWLGRVISESYLKKQTFTVIQNGIDLTVFQPVSSDLRSRLNIPNNKYVVLCVASLWTHRKGINEIVKIANDTEYQVIIIGKIGVKEEQIPNNVIKIDRTNNQAELVLYYSASDVFLNPTYNDTFPTVNMESLACGTPIVTYETGGSPEIIDEKTGIVVKRGDYEGLLNALEKVRNRGKHYYSEECIKRACENFNRVNSYKKYYDLYKRLLNI